MKAKSFFIVLCAMMALCSCDGPNKVSSVVSGKIVGTICTKDTINNEIVQGYYIITSTNDSILTFSETVKISTYYGISGIYGLLYDIPFQFTYKLLDPHDAEYIHYNPYPICYFDKPGMTYPKEHFKQAVVNRIE